MSFKIVTDDLNNYFRKNIISLNSDLPTEGKYNVGDIIISSDQNIFGWVCTVSGTPGEWKEIIDFTDLIEDISSLQLQIDEISNKVNILDDINQQISDLEQSITDINDKVDNEIQNVDGIKEGMVNTLVSKGIEADVNMTWEELFGLMYVGMNTEVSIPCTSITLDKDYVEFSALGETVTLVATVSPSNTTDKVNWSTDDNGSIITLNSGNITSVGSGECSITATCGEYSVTIPVIVNLTEDVDTNAIVLYDSGNVNEGTEFGSMYMQNINNTDNTLNCNLTDTYTAGWCVFSKEVNFDLYDRIEITTYAQTTEQSYGISVYQLDYEQDPGIDYAYSVSITNSPGRYPLTGISGTSPKTYSFDMKKFFDLTNTSMGYLGISADRYSANDGIVYISKIVVYKGQDDTEDIPCTSVTATQAAIEVDTTRQSCIIDMNQYFTVEPADTTDIKKWSSRVYTVSSSVSSPGSITSDGRLAIPANTQATVYVTLTCGDYNATITVSAYDLSD